MLLPPISPFWHCVSWFHFHFGLVRGGLTHCPANRAINKLNHAVRQLKLIKCISQNSGSGSGQKDLDRTWLGGSAGQFLIRKAIGMRTKPGISRMHSVSVSVSGSQSILAHCLETFSNRDSNLVLCWAVALNSIETLNSELWIFNAILNISAHCPMSLAPPAVDPIPLDPGSLI